MTFLYESAVKTSIKEKWIINISNKRVRSQHGIGKTWVAEHLPKLNQCDLMNFIQILADYLSGYLWELLENSYSAKWFLFFWQGNRLLTRRALIYVTCKQGSKEARKRGWNSSIQAKSGAYSAALHIKAWKPGITMYII